MAGTIVDRLIAEATGPYGERRFYPVGQHPASYRSRVMADRLRRVLDIARPHLEPHREADTEAAIAYHERKVAEVETGEARAKQLYVRAYLR